LISFVGIIFLTLILILTAAETPFFPLRLELNDTTGDTIVAIGITIAVIIRNFNDFLEFFS